jgi:flagellar biosynthesis protein FliQ
MRKKDKKIMNFEYLLIYKIINIYFKINYKNYEKIRSHLFNWWPRVIFVTVIKILPIDFCLNSLYKFINDIYDNSSIKQYILIMD